MHKDNNYNSSLNDRVLKFKQISTRFRTPKDIRDNNIQFFFPISVSLQRENEMNKEANFTQRISLISLKKQFILYSNIY